MTIRSLRVQKRPDTLTTQVRVGQSLARRIYVAGIFAGLLWICWLIAGPLLLMDADGLVVKQRTVVGASFPATLTSVQVRPGDTVHAGQLIGTVISAQMLDAITDLSNREMQARARLSQIDARLTAVAATLPMARKNLSDAIAAVHAIDIAKRGGYTTRSREAEVSNARYAAEKELSGLQAEDQALRSERTGLTEGLARIETAMKRTQDNYQNGAIYASRDGTIGPGIQSPGTALTSGEVVTDIYYGDNTVKAYLPTDRLYSLDRGDRVFVSDGRTRVAGTVLRIDAIADKLPAEFQSGFRSIERRQIVSIALKGSDDFPLLSKVRVSKPWAPWNVVANAAVFAAESVGWSAAARAGKAPEPDWQALAANRP